MFALFSETGDDLQPTCHSEEALSRVLARVGKGKGKRKARTLLSADEYRYFAEEFEYHQAGEEHFAGVTKITE